MSGKMHGWYSPNAAARIGVVVYRRPGGTLTHVTHVNDDPHRHGTGWADACYVGEVTEYVSRTPPLCGFDVSGSMSGMCREAAEELGLTDVGAYRGLSIGLSDPYLRAEDGSLPPRRPTAPPPRRKFPVPR